MIENMAVAAANKIKKINPDETAPHDVLVFGLTILINLMITFFLIAITGFILGKLALAMQVTLSFIIVRILTGGAHLDRSFACSINSLCLVIAILWIPISTELVLAYMIITILFLLRFAPYYEPHQMKHSEQWERKKKSLALIWVFISLTLYILFDIPGFLIGSFLQAILLTPFAIKFTHKLNSIISKGGENDEKRNSKRYF